MMEGPGPKHQRWESPRPVKVAIKELRDGGEGRTNQSGSSCSGFSCVVRWRGMQQHQNTSGTSLQYNIYYDSLFFQDYNKELEKSAVMFIKEWLNFKR